MSSIPKYTQDFYSILHITPNATGEEITKAYRKLARMYHPDKNRSIGSTATFQLVGQAYSVLSDPIQRSEYDREDYSELRITSSPGNSASEWEYDYDAWDFPDFETHDFKDNCTSSHSTKFEDPDIESKRLFRELLPDHVLSSGCLPLRWREILYQYQNQCSSHSVRDGKGNIDFTSPTKCGKSDGRVEGELERYRGNVKVIGGDWIGDKGWDGFVLYGCNWT